MSYHKYPEPLRAQTPIAAVNFPTAPIVRERTGDPCHCVFLDQITVAEGLYSKQRISSTHELVIGDEYRFPHVADDSPSCIRVDGNDAVIELGGMIEVGRAAVRANRTHKAVLMSGNGHVLAADIFLTHQNRAIVALHGTARGHEDYALISMSPTLAD